MLAFLLFCRSLTQPSCGCTYTFSPLGVCTHLTFLCVRAQLCVVLPRQRLSAVAARQIRARFALESRFVPFPFPSHFLFSPCIVTTDFPLPFPPKSGFFLLLAPALHGCRVCSRRAAFKWPWECGWARVRSYKLLELSCSSSVSAVAVAPYLLGVSSRDHFPE